ncbi:Extracellular matrix-binding ebh [Babesia ovata]|uniref:Extracellular matrix-binding ebh n=1 Tax=Babesia ovata TaxID=189622 RepID=A0A2H6K8M7_9APIC|nr:Extracellular matrix-binding ebh [Babesia ovata]GBE59347.1 Extracellular matrix-binding ebh [Babesia ovata]
MAPKALTDCPENLREAIDWLIHVKQGDGIPKLSYALSKLFDNVVQDAQKSLWSLPESHHTSARDVIGKLQTFQNAVTKNSENPNQDTLHNLCSALETFLGYRSPGTYDGSGIVYGDASRLCDAIVAFLYRVFSDVRDNQPYVVGRVLLGGLVGDLEKARWSGHHGFKHVIPKVAAGLGAYNDAVKASNDRVKRPIDDMIAYVAQGGELLKRVNGLQVESVTEEEVKKAERLVEECQKRADAFYNDMNKVASTTSAIKDLNPTLRDKVMSAKKHMTQERKRLQNLTRKERDNLEAMTKIIRKALRELENNVSNKIGEQIDALVAKVKAMVEKIRDMLIKIYDSLGKYVDELEAWITEAKKFIAFAERNVKKMLNEVTVNESGDKPERWKKIEENVNKIDQGLDKEIKDLQAWINNAEETRGKAEKRAKEAFSILSYYKDKDRKNKTELAENIQNILDAKEQIGKINSQLTKNVGDLEQWKNAADGLLGNVIGATGTVRGKLSPTRTKDGTEENNKIGINIENIRNAKLQLDQAKDNLAAHLGSLESWKGEAYTVIGAAVQKATEVYEKLNPEKNGPADKNVIGTNISTIDAAQKAIDTANKDLQTEVSHLNEWKTAAEKIVQAGQNKCDEILTKTEIKNGDPVIKQQAAALQKKATDLLTAYEKAYPKVDGLKNQVEQAISHLEEGIKTDLVDLQQRIVSSMKSHVGLMLGEIRTQVQGIKGEAGKDDKNTGANGLDGIVTGLVNSYAGGFSGEWPFQKIVEGWLEKVLGKDGANKKEVENWINTYVTEKVRLLGFSIASFRDKIMEQTKKTLNHEIQQAGELVKAQMDSAETIEKITKTIEAVKSGCDEFVKQLDDKFKKGIKALAQEIVNKTNYRTTNDNLQLVTEFTLIALRATANQVGEEINSILLADYRMGKDSGTSIAKELDKAVQATRDLDKKLEAAHQATSSDVSNDPKNNILQKVKEIEQQVKNEMKDNGPKGIIVETTMGQYKKKKDQEPIGDEGKYQKLLKDIPQAMQPFNTHAQLTDASKVERQKELVTQQFQAIEQELQAIAWFVNSKKGEKPKTLPQPTDQDGIKQRLDDLENMLKEAGAYQIMSSLGVGINKDVKGLQAIEDKIKDLKTRTYDIKTKEIGEALPNITQKLGELRNKLQNPVNNVKDDVINRLYDLQYTGLKQNAWSPNRLRIYGLGKIHGDIAQLQKNQFTENPSTIGGAVHIITQSLNNLQSDLDKKVTAKLERLKSYGLNHTENWDGNHNAKGFDTIKEGIEKHNEELGKQPNAIEKAVENIRLELAKIGIKLHNVMLDGDVVDHLRVLRTLISKHNNSQGLQAIYKAIDGVHTLVPVVNAKLTELCEAIKMPGISIKEALGRLKALIDHDYVVINGGEQHGLNEIKNELKRLRAYLLSGPIEACEQFLRDADATGRLAKQKIREHLHQQIKIAEDAMIAQANANYVSSVKQMLQQYASKVNSELVKLPDEIDHDLAIGFKGFVKQIAGDNNGNINLLTDAANVGDLSYRFNVFCGRLRMYIEAEIKREHHENMSRRNPIPRSPETLYTNQLAEIYTALNDLLSHLTRQKHYDREIRGKLDKLIDAVNALRPQGFTKPNSPLLDGIGEGLRAFVAEFTNCYISAYSGAQCREADADKYAKVLLSMVPMTHDALTNLATKCGTNWKTNKICTLTPDGRDNGLGNYLTKCGYKVSPTDGLQEGELQNQFSGGAAYELLKSPIPDVNIKMLVDGEPLENGINVVDLVALFHNMVCRYLQACHLKVHASPRYPCTVRDMLSWLSGLQYTLVAYKLNDHCRALLNRQCDDSDIINRDDEVMAQCINSLPYTIASACSYANSLLIAIQGHGRGFDLAAYPYSVDLANNRAKLHYPADPAELLDMMREIVCRLCPVLYFLYAQCCRATAETKGWRECHYGRQVPQATDASHSCPPNSPLQSFLSDSCLNLLPHRLTVVDNAIECANCPSNQPGQQCLTPLGFCDLGLAASMRRTGKELAKSLGRLCSDADACLFQLCRTLSLLCPSAPQSLGDVFALFTHLLRTWDHESSRRAYSHHESYISHLNDEAIDKLFPLWTELHGSYQNSNLTDALKALAGHDHNNSGHNALSSLSAEPPCQTTSGCAPFLQPLSLYANHTFPQKHAQLCLTWVVHLAWQLWQLLQQLRDALDNIDCTAHGCATYLCPTGNHGGEDACHCPSIVECGGPLPTLYRYGFTYRNAHVLVAGSQKMRCSDINGQLNKTLHSNHFTELFHQIDELLWYIRMPFLFTLVALWSIAFFLLIHTLLYRLDVLRIRSHLMRTKASHLIDAKALLTKGRRMLSLHHGVDYFDDEPVD